MPRPQRLRTAALLAASSLVLLAGCCLAPPLMLLVALSGALPKNMAGKDTVWQFGDGTWSLDKTGSRASDDRKVWLRSGETQTGLNSPVIDWRQSGPWVYLLCDDGTYAVLNHKASELATYPRPDDAPEEHRAGLGRLRPR